MPTSCQSHPCSLPPQELPHQVMQHTHKGFARTVFSSELDKYVSSLFNMKYILCSCPGWTLIRPRLSFQASLCKESGEETGCLTDPRRFAAFGHQKDTSVLPQENLPLTHHGGIPFPEGMGCALAAPAHHRSHRTPTGAPPGWHQDPAHPQAPTDEHGAATVLISVGQQEAADSVFGRSMVSTCPHFSIPEQGWGHLTPLHCCLQWGWVPGRARGAQGRGSAAASTFNG